MVCVVKVPSVITPMTWLVNQHQPVDITNKANVLTEIGAGWFNLRRFPEVGEMLPEPSIFLYLS